MKKIICLFICLFAGSAHSAAVYMNSTVGAPWGQSSNEASMDGVFGAGNWLDLDYETVNTGSLFSNSTDFIFMEGGDGSANKLEAFIITNQPSLENWVATGGRLIINSAPNVGDGMSFGFGVSLNYPDISSGLITAVDPGHDIFNGSFGNTGSTFTGSAFAHATVSGAGLNDLILNQNSDSVLSDMFYSNGYVMFGGMTTLNFQRPNSFELRQNIISYAANVDLKAQTVSEPGMLVLLSIGFAGIGFSRKRREV